MQRELRLQPLGRSELYSRRTAEIRKRTTEKNCDRCKVPFEQNESFLAVDSTSWHLRCFLCAQCFEPISDATYYNVDGRMYCEHDFKVLYAPICAKCGEFVIGHVIKSINCSYHPDCFKCSECSNNLDEGVYIFDAKLYCSDCNKFLERKPTYICKKCKQLVDEDEFLHFEGEIYHASHFDCSDCKKTLTKNARQKDKDLFCERCFDLRCESCADCRTPIDPQKERSILVLGRHYHLNHFRCAACGQPFAGKEHYERGNKAFCKEDYTKLFGDHCHYCNRGLVGKHIRLFGKSFCAQCYRCMACDKVLDIKDKVAEVDQRPMCKKCLGRKEWQKAMKYKQNKQ